MLKEMIEQEKLRNERISKDVEEAKGIVITARKGLQDLLLATQCVWPSPKEMAQRLETDLEKQVHVTSQVQVIRNRKPSLLEPRGKKRKPYLSVNDHKVAPHLLQ